MRTVATIRRSAILTPEEFISFRDWLVRMGWTIEKTLSRAEILRASKLATPRSKTRKYIFGYHSHDSEVLNFFDEAAELVKTYKGEP